MTPSFDLLAHLSAELHAARVAAATAVDRADALQALLTLADARAGDLNQAVLTPAQLFDTPGTTERDRAHLAGLTTRAFPDPESKEAS